MYTAHTYNVNTVYSLQCGICFRYLTRTTIIPFSFPAVGPVSEDEYVSYSELNSLIQQGEFSCCIGWVISLGGMLNESCLANIKRSCPS